METIREQVISAIIARVESIRTANGYNTECGQEVKRAAKDLEPGDLPAAVVWPQTEAVERRSGRNICTTQVKVETYMAFGSVNPSMAQEQMLGDLVKCVTGPGEPVTTLADDLFYKEGGPAGQPEAGEKITAVVATFEVKYSYKIGNPYEQ
ncbi:hypothetical protein [Desulfoluna spongiiphila]|uniref:hypothetical protein n=1 Tax=Desulfoluna spongiiphila TaxID=419481 RepID=UPI001252B997|nr:hypothetical protein [Desulfoluna spongiiphila]VVS95353.1 hypothetical protein DBB_49300 [Desulfoluna spongiiphila]